MVRCADVEDNFSKKMWGFACRGPILKKFVKNCVENKIVGKFIPN